MPANARLDHTAIEFHHYQSVLDHYETRTRTYTELVLDGYDTHYEDNGNGTAQLVQTPRYRTETRTETYQEPVYRNDPVYQTKYYYYIDRWKVIDTKTTSGTTRSAYWPELDLPTKVSNPRLGDRKIGNTTEKYYVEVVDSTNETRYIEMDYSIWIEYSNKTIEYKTFRFSHKPLGGK